MDTRRPKRPTTLALFPQLAQPRSQDTINNNSLGKKDSWKESCSSSPRITGDIPPPDAQLKKPEDKVCTGNRRLAPKLPVANGAGCRTNTNPRAPAIIAGDTRPRLRYKLGNGESAHSAGGQRCLWKGGGGKLGGGGVRRERSLREGRGRGEGEKQGARLCEGREKQGHQRTPGAVYGLRSQKDDGRGKLAKEGSGSRGANTFRANLLGSKNICLTAMVVPRTPVALPKQEITRDQLKEDRDKWEGTQDERENTGVQDQNNSRSQDGPVLLSRTSSGGGSKRMSLSSDTEGPPPGPLPERTNPIISKEDGESEPASSVNTQDGAAPSAGGHENKVTECAESRGKEATSEEVFSKGAMDCDASFMPATTGDPLLAGTTLNGEVVAGLSYDSMKYTLVVDEHSQLQLVKLKDCYHGSRRREGANDDSDTETVYQSANEEEDPEYERERKRKEDEKKGQDRMKERRTEEDRRREVVAKFSRRFKVTSNTTFEEDEAHSGRAIVPRTRKFLNLFVGGGPYSSAGTESFGVFSCFLHGVERQQSHRAVYRFVPRHADELILETDDPVLTLSQSEDLWCQGYNMRTGAIGIFPAYYAVTVPNNTGKANDGWTDRYTLRFMGSVQVPFHKGNDVLCAAMQKVACNRRLTMQPASFCILEVSVRGLKISVQDQCCSSTRGDKCSHFFQMKNISFCGCHPKHSRYFGFISKHPDQQRFACHVMVSETTLHPLADSVGRAFHQFYKEHVGYSCPTEDIFIE